MIVNGKNKANFLMKKVYYPPGIWMLLYTFRVEKVYI
jgi:hypothetical protein